MIDNTLSIPGQANNQTYCDNCKSLITNDMSISGKVCNVCKKLIDLEIKSIQTVCRCNNCNSHFFNIDKKAPEFCPVCCTKLNPDITATIEFPTPFSFLPFKIAENEAIMKFLKWKKQFWFMPKHVRTLLNNINSPVGVFLPYRNFSFELEVGFTGKKGMNHTQRTNYSVMENGKLVFRTKETHKTFWNQVTDSFSFKKNNHLIASFSGIYIFLKNLFSYTNVSDYIKFDAQKSKDKFILVPQNTPRKDFDIALQQIEADINYQIRKKIGGNSQEITSKQLTFNNISFWLTLIPVWLIAGKTVNKNFYFALDGQSGKVYSKRPVNKGLWLFVAFIVSLIIFLVYRL